MGGRFGSNGCMHYYKRYAGANRAVMYHARGDHRDKRGDDFIVTIEDGRVVRRKGTQNLSRSSTARSSSKRSTISERHTKRCATLDKARTRKRVAKNLEPIVVVENGRIVKKQRPKLPRSASSKF